MPILLDKHRAAADTDWLGRPRVRKSGVQDRRRQADRVLVTRKIVLEVVCTHGARCLWKWRRRYASFTLASLGWPTGVLDRGEFDEVERDPGWESAT